MMFRIAMHPLPLFSGNEKRSHTIFSCDSFSGRCYNFLRKIGIKKPLHVINVSGLKITPILSSIAIITGAKYTVSSFSVLSLS